MAEKLTLTNPVTTPAIILSDYRVVFLSFDIDASQITINLRGTNGELLTFVYGGWTATQAERDSTLTMIKTLNTANLTTNSMHKRVLNKLVADGKLTGTVTGTPD